MACKPLGTLGLKEECLPEAHSRSDSRAGLLPELGRAVLRGNAGAALVSCTRLHQWAAELEEKADISKEEALVPLLS